MLKWIKSFLQGMLLFLLPMDGPILQPDDHYILRYYAAIMRVVRPTMHQVFKLLRPNDARTLKELVFSIEGYSQTKYKRQFDESERQRLDNNEPSETYDISLLYKLLQLVCNLASSSDTKWNESGTLEYFLKQMKNERNILAHEDICFTFDELQRRVVFLEDICHNALVAASQRSGQSVEGDIDNMKRKMEEVLVGGIDLWEPYREALKDLRNKQSNVLVRVGREDLTKLAQKLRILNPFAWLLDDNYSHLDVEHIFTKVTIQGKEDIQMEELLVTTLQSGDIPDVTILSGPPGIGKTSLLRFMVQDWLSFHPTMQGLENVDLLLPVELRHVVSDNAKDLVIELLPSVSQHLQNDDIFIALNNISVVWLLDGFDEASLEVQKVIKELLKKSPNSKILITTRTEYTQEIENIVRGIHRLSLSMNIKGFSFADIEIFAKKLIDVYVKNDEKAGFINQFMKFCKEEKYSPQWEIFTVPLLLTISLTLWLDSHVRLSNIKTMSALYSFLVDHIIQKLIARESFSHLRVKERKSSLHKKINEFLDVLGFILLKDVVEYTLLENEVDLLEEKCKDLQIPFKDTMSAFFVFSEVETASGIKEEYTIIHRTLKEFLSARAFCNHMITEGWDVMTTAGNWIQRTRDTLKSTNCLDLCGKYNLENLDMEKPSENYVNNSRKILEVNNSSLCRQNNEHCLLCLSFRDIQDDNYYTHFMVQNGLVFGIPRSRSYWCHIKDILHPVILRYIIGYLCLKQEMNPSRAEQLDFSAHNLMGNSVDFQYVYSLLKEGSSSQFSMEFSKFLQKVLWSFMFINIEPLFYAELLLQSVTPDDIHLHYCVGLRENPWEFLIRSIQTVKMCHSDVHLDLRNIFACPNSDKELIKGCLKELLHERAVARLVTLHSPLDKEGIKLLETAAYLKEISIKVSAYDLPVAAEVLGKLPSLQTLRIAVDAANYGSLDHPNLNVGHENLSDFVIVLLETYQLQPEVVGEMLSKISPYCKHVILSGSVFSLSKDRFFGYVTFIKSNLRFIKQIDFMFDNSAEKSFGYFLSYKDLEQYFKDVHPDVVIQVKGYDKLNEY